MKERKNMADANGFNDAGPIRSATRNSTNPCTVLSPSPNVRLAPLKSPLTPSVRMMCVRQSNWPARKNSNSCQYTVTHCHYNAGSVAKRADFSNRFPNFDVSRKKGGRCELGSENKKFGFLLALFFY